MRSVEIRLISAPAHSPTDRMPTPIRSHTSRAKTAVSTVQVIAIASPAFMALGTKKRTAQMNAPSIATDRAVSIDIALFFRHRSGIEST